MGRALRDVTDESWTQPNSTSIDAQAAAASEDVTHHIFIGMNDVLGIRGFRRTKGDEAAAELLFLEAVLVANLVVEFGKALKRGLEIDDFH